MNDPLARHPSQENCERDNFPSPLASDNEEPTVVFDYQQNDDATIVKNADPGELDPSRFRLIPEYDREQRYVSQGVIAKGGMGSIEKVFDTLLCRLLARKTLNPNHSSHDSAKLFVTETRITCMVDHPSVTPIHDLGVDEAGNIFYTMKLISGSSLKNLIHSSQAFKESFPRFLQIFLKICDAVSYAHSKGIIHRDLKPANVMVGSHGEVYVVDWGLAINLQERTAEQIVPNGSDQAERACKDPASSSPVGTPAYMAPEQAMGFGERIDERTDVFLLGAILYEIVTRRPPFKGDGKLGDSLYLAACCDYVPPENLAPDNAIPASLCDLINKAMAKEPTARYPSVLALRADLEKIIFHGLLLPMVTYRAGEKIVNEGETGDTAYLIQKGSCAVYRTVAGRRYPIATLGPGEVFGEVALLASVVRTATVEALENVEVLEVSKQCLHEEINWGSWIGTLVQALACRFRDTSELMIGLENKLHLGNVAFKALQYLSFIGKRIDPDRLECSWARLRSLLLKDCSLTETQLITALQAESAFVLIPEQDLVQVYSPRTSINQ